ncbi:MAG: hypothetical protein HC830_03750 [Bacteroidetes bacterium]|nr:hypothetical protein [Bacteroidota bacterium]
MAHPLGANFREGVFITNYQFKRLFLESKTTWAKYGLDPKGSNWGKNIFIPYTLDSISSDIDHPKLFQGIATTLFTTNLEASYVINPRTNMSFSAGYYIRKESSVQFSRSIGMIYLAFRTSLTNLYLDF